MLWAGFFGLCSLVLTALGWLAYRHGRKDERNAALEHSSELANDRAGIDADVRRLSDSELDDGLREFTRK